MQIRIVISYPVIFINIKIMAVGRILWKIQERFMHISRKSCSSSLK